MATYLFSVLTNNQNIAFDPLNDVLVFDTYLSGGSPVVIRPAELLINGAGGNVQFSVGGKTIVLTGTLLDDLGTSSATLANNVQFNSTGILLVGDATTDQSGNLANVITGGVGDDALLGLGGDDALDGGLGGDLMVGGLGNDTYVVDNVNDIITEENNSLAGAGTDLVNAGISYTLTNNVENLVLTGTDATNGTGNTLNNTITGNSANNVLNGVFGADIMIGNDGNDTYVVDNIGDKVIETNASRTQIDTVSTSISYFLGANLENLVLTGLSGLVGVGNTRENQITGNIAANTLNGWLGADTMTGGDGNDIYVVDNADDTVVETNATLTQVDMVASTISQTLGVNLENLRLLGSANLNGTGNGLNNILFANAGNNTLNGLGGNDTASYADVTIMSLVKGSPTTSTTTVSATAGVVVDLTIVGSQDTQGSGSDRLINIENLTGSNYNDELTGNGNVNILDGGAGEDLLTGGNGNDTYVVDGGDDVVELNGNAGGLDTVLSSVSHRLADSVEYLVLTGTAANGTGNSLDNQLTGNSSNNVLDGRAGADKMDGGFGNDTYVVDNFGDEITDSSGTDNVQTYINHTLASAIENLRLMGSNALNGTGSALNNVVWTNSANNLVDGMGGTDTVSYQFGANAGVTVNLSITSAQATGGSGSDTITNFENLTGSDYDDFLLGSNAVNILDGLGGIDTVSYAGASSAVIINLATERATTQVGISTIIDTIRNFENIVGSNFDDVLTGDTGDNKFNGGSSADTVSYANVLSNEGGVVVDLSIAGAQDTLASGIDTLISIENVTGSLNNDILDGSSTANVIDGSGGNDIIEGGLGDDTLYGGLGTDTLTYGSAASRITISLAIIASQATGGADADTIAGFENLTGSSFSDTLTGDDGANLINGGSGADSITGGGGADTLIGGSGVDTFRFAALSDSGDTINDFAGAGAAGGDKINLQAIDATPGGANNAFAFGGTSAVAHGVWYSVSDGDATVNVDTDGVTATIEMTIKLLNVTSLNQADFVL